LLFAALSIFYGMNIYTNWFAASSHTQAFFGFIFYLWLGAWSARDRKDITSWIERFPMPTLIALVVVSALASLGEGLFLIRLGTDEPANSLRISNQIFSVAAVLLIFRARKPLWPRMVNVRANTYGIFLIHPFAIWILTSILRRTILGRVSGLTGGAHMAAAFCLLLVFFAATYGCSLALTRWLLKIPRLRWTVGNFALNRR
jgi:membrane-bound acyltransferase YfiQ involved in biofilm formation